uniref:Uncharacterized protein n=1 Tax=Glossina morsitans morsitans TaxID=37546 RepID=A0A1B0FEL0_GLOMM
MRTTLFMQFFWPNDLVNVFPIKFRLYVDTDFLIFLCNWCTLLTLFSKRAINSSENWGSDPLLLFLLGSEKLQSHLTFHNEKCAGAFVELSCFCGTHSRFCGTHSRFCGAQPLFWNSQLSRIDASSCSTSWDCCQFDFHRTSDFGLSCPWRISPKKIKENNVAERLARQC